MREGEREYTERERERQGGREREKLREPEGDPEGDTWREGGEDVYGAGALIMEVTIFEEETQRKGIWTTRMTPDP